LAYAAAVARTRARQERSVETRARLLHAAAEVIARHGIEGATVDAISGLAERTSGSLYGQFGSKDALILELLDQLKQAVADRIGKQMVTADTLDARLVVLWRNFIASPDGERDWLRLEHELWVWATRPGHDIAREQLSERYRAEYELLAGALALWESEGLIRPSLEPRRMAAAVVALLLGLEMTHRLDPSSVDEPTAVASLKALLKGE
jgi:AcrR family transcriptional regulator